MSRQPRKSYYHRDSRTVWYVGNRRPAPIDITWKSLHMLPNGQLKFWVYESGNFHDLVVDASDLEIRCAGKRYEYALFPAGVKA